MKSCKLQIIHERQKKFENMNKMDILLSQLIIDINGYVHVKGN